MGFKHVLGLELNVELCANKIWNASNPWHVAASQTIKLSPIIDCDEYLWRKYIGCLGVTTLDHYGCINNYRTLVWDGFCWMNWNIYRKTIERHRLLTLQGVVREPESFYGSLKLIFYFWYQQCQYRWKLNTKLNCKD